MNQAPAGRRRDTDRRTVVSALLALSLSMIPLPIRADPPARAEPATLDSQDWRRAWRIPAEIPFPDDDPYSDAKADLGHRLFEDPVLSGQQTISCSSCHNPEHGWSDGRAKAIGVSAKPLKFRAPTILDVAFFDRFGWDGKFPDLESVAEGPMRSLDNMNISKTVLIDRLQADPAYRARFSAAFGDAAIDWGRIEQALATYQRTLVARDAPFDRWIAGDETAIDAAAKRGFDLFTHKGRCAECHGGFAFSDGSFHDIGIERGDDLGRGRFFPTSIKLRYAFKTPTLRDVVRRAPYMHDGSIPTLEAVIDFYDRGGIDRPSRAEALHPLRLDARDKADLLAFLETLTSPTPPATEKLSTR